MNDANPYQSPRFPSRQPAPVHGRKALRSRIFTAAIAGAAIGYPVSILAVFVVGSTAGHMNFEMSAIFAVFFGTVCAIPAAVAGVFVGAAEGPQARTFRLLVSVVFGGVCSAAIYAFIVVPQATAPAVVIFWVGVVPFLSGMVAGAVGGLIGLGDRRIWWPAPSQPAIATGITKSHARAKLTPSQRSRQN